MLPLYKQTMRFVSDPYLRMKKQAVVGFAMALALLFVFFLALSVNQGGGAAGNGDLLAAAAPTPLTAVQPAHKAVNGEPTLEALTPPPFYAEDGDDDAAPAREQPGVGEKPVAAANDNNGVNADEEEEEEVKKITKMPWIVRLLLPLVAGYCFGFLGSVPIAGPTSAMVLKLGIQGKYQAALTIAVGGAISEATYAAIAFWGFGSFLAGAKFLLPVSKVLGAVMFTAVGIVFLRSEMKPSMDPEVGSSRGKGMGKARGEVYKNVLLGVTMSGINPALLATYTGAIASVYGTGMLEFNLFLALVFGLGVCGGVSSWFYLLLLLLKKYKQRLKDQTIGLIMRCMGIFLLTLGLFCAKSSFDYFVWGPSVEGK